MPTETQSSATCKKRTMLLWTMWLLCSSLNLRATSKASLFQKIHSYLAESKSRRTKLQNNVAVFSFDLFQETVCGVLGFWGLANRFLIVYDNFYELIIGELMYKKNMISVSVITKKD